MENADKLHAELTELRARIKPATEWRSYQDRLDQRAIEQRIRMLESNLKIGDEGPRPG